MALNRTTKSVAFSDGIHSSDVDDFLLPAPAVEYLENANFHKEGSFTKRPGCVNLGKVPNPKGDPFFTHAIGNSLYVLKEDGAGKYQDGEWTEIQSDGYIGTQERVLESSNGRGQGDFNFVVTKNAAGEIQNYVVAFSVKERSSSTGTTTSTWEHVIVQSYDAEGKYLNQYRIDQARTPRLVYYGNQLLVGLVYTEDGTRNLMFQQIFPKSSGDLVIGAPVDTTINVSNEVGSYGFSQPDVMPRLGSGSEISGRYHVGYDSQEDLIIVGYDVFEGELFYAKLDTLGAKQGASVPLATVDTNGNDILGMTVSPGRVHFLVANYQSPNDGLTGHSWSVNYMEYLTTFDAAPQRNEIIESGSAGVTKETDLNYGGPVFDHGSILDTEPDTGLQRVVCFYHCPGYATSEIAAADNGFEGIYDALANNVRYPLTGVRAWAFNYATGTNSDNPLVLSGHRLTTNPVWHDGGIYMGVQKWADWTPNLYGKDMAKVLWYALTPPANKPVTTALVRVEADGLLESSMSEVTFTTRPVAVVDSGVSVHVDYTESETNFQLNSLVQTEPGVFEMGNRVIVAPGSYSLFIAGDLDTVGTTPPVQTNTPRRQSAADVSGDALFRLTRIQSGSKTEIYGAPFGDGVLLSTAVPMWFNGEWFGEAAVLDAPDIIHLEDYRYTKEQEDEFGDVPFAGAQGLPTFYEVPISSPNSGDSLYPSDEWRKFQAVYGYSDSAGNIHRSAPSSIVYVHNLHESSGNPNADTYFGRSVWVTVTPPLSVMPDSQEYFVEIYVSKKDDDDPRVVAHATYPTDGKMQPLRIHCQVNRNLPEGANNVDEVDLTSPFVYTLGGTLAADPFPAWQKSVVTSRRMWAIDPVNKGSIIYTKLFEEYMAPEYNSSLRIPLGDERNLTAIGQLDDKVVIFEPEAIHVIYGTGPDNVGKGQDFEVHYIASSVGCSDHQSLIETPGGLIFYYEKRGFYILRRNLQLEFIGDPIQDISSGLDVLSATLVASAGEVRFLVTLPPGETQAPRFGPDPGTTNVPRPPRPFFENVLPEKGALAYDYEKNRWTVYSDYEGRASTIYQGKYVHILPDWSTWQDDKDFRQPVGENRLLFRTPWIPFTEVQDYSRVWGINFLGRYLSSLQRFEDGTYEAGDIKVTLWYDREYANPQVEIFRVQDFEFYKRGEQLYRPERLQFRISPEQGRGRTSAVKIQIEEVPSEDQGEGLSYSLGAGFEIVSAQFDLGVDQRQTPYIPGNLRR